MRRKLKTLEQIKKEFNYFISDSGNIHLSDFCYYIHVNMFDKFGKYIDVELRTNGYYCDEHWVYNERWFELDNFIEEEEFKV